MNLLKPIIVFAIMLVAPPLLGQVGQEGRGKVIEVTGSAELEVTPDEIYLSITLREYVKDKIKQRIEQLDKEFMQVLEELKIDRKNVSIEGVSAYHDWDYWKRKPTDVMASKTYILKLGDLAKYNQLMLRLDQAGVEQVYLQRTGHSKMEEYRRTVKVEALKAAKEKARLLLESIGEQPGEVLLVREVNQGQNFAPMFRGASNMAMDAGQESTGADMQKIKLRYEVEAHFRIK